MPVQAQKRIEIGSLAELDHLLSSIPDAPAVFLIRVRSGAPYLARTGVLRRRLRRLLGERSGASRVLTLRTIATAVEYWLTGSRLESSLVLYHAAIEHFPDTYLKLLKLRMPPYVKVVLSNEFPRTMVTSKVGGSSSFYYGPFRTRGAAEMFETELLDLFQVRRCQEDLVPAPDHPGCIYGEMGMCLRPCQLAVGREEYHSEVDRVIGFLRTSGKSLQEPLVSARRRLSEEMNFEEAARIHKRIEKIDALLKSRDELAADVDRLCGVAVAPSADAASVQLFFMLGGVWQDTVRFNPEAGESIDHGLREIISRLQAGRLPGKRRQEHLALLARWFYSSWRDGEWLPFRSPEEFPYRRAVRAISKALSKAVSDPGR